MRNINMKPEWMRIAWFLGAVLFFVSCEKKKTEADLVADFRNMDNLLRRGTFRYDSMKWYLSSLREGFVNHTHKELAYDAWKTNVTYRWTTDSSTVLIYANKRYPVGFSRELIVHSGDSVLFVHRFSTEPLGLYNKKDFSFLESVYYLTERGTIRHLARISYREKDLADTIAFRKKPFAELTDDVSHYYSLELNHSRNILTLN